MTEVKYLALDQVMRGATRVLGRTPELRDAGLLDAALNRARASAFGQDAYPDLHTKAAAILHSIVTSHPFVDGNKRMGWATAEVFLALNGEPLVVDTDAAFELVMAAASGELTEVDKIAEMLRRFA